MKTDTFFLYQRISSWHLAGQNLWVPLFLIFVKHRLLKLPSSGCAADPRRSSFPLSLVTLSYPGVSPSQPVLISALHWSTKKWGAESSADDSWLLRACCTRMLICLTADWFTPVIRANNQQRCSKGKIKINFKSMNNRKKIQLKIPNF